MPTGHASTQARQVVHAQSVSALITLAVTMYLIELRGKRIDDRLVKTSLPGQYVTVQVKLERDLTEALPEYGDCILIYLESVS